MGQMFNERAVLGIHVVADGTLMHNNQPVIGIVDAGAALFVDNQRTRGISVLLGSEVVSNDQPVIGAVLISDGRKLYNGSLVVPFNGVSGDGFDFSTAVAPTGITFTRASTATCVNASGALETVAVDGLRFDYNAASLAYLGILIEPERTNLCLHSADFTNAAWIYSAASVSANAAPAPDGTLTADKIIDTAAASDHSVRQAVTAVLGGTYTFSAFVKAAGRTQASLLFYTDANVYKAVVDLASGTLVNGSGTGSCVITDYGNGWYRIEITAVTTSTTLNGFIMTASGGATTYAGDGVSGVYCWGAQIEAASGATTLIPSGAAAGTASADVLTLNWASRAVPDGSITVRYTFADGTTQDVAMTVAAGSSTVPTNLNRSRIRSIERIA